MGKKITLFLLSVLALLIGAVREEFGLIKTLEGNILISRNNELISPILSSRVYFDDFILVSENSLVKIRSNYHSELTIKPLSKIKISGPDRFEKTYGNYQLDPFYDDLPKHKSLTQAVTYTAILPGTGHLYINNYPKGIAFSLISLFLLTNIVTIDPGSSVSGHEILFNKKEQYQQVYLAFWILSLFDVTSETNALNKRISAEEAEIAGE